MKDPIVEVNNSPASFGAGGGNVITDSTTTYPGPFYLLKAQGGDVVINTAAIPATWSGGTQANLNGLTISNGDFIAIRGITGVKLTSGTVLAYKESATLQ